MKNQHQHTRQSIEWQKLAFDYKHVRIRSARSLDRLTISMRRMGQLHPILVCEQSAESWVVIDGYSRAEVWQSLGHDTIDVHFCEGSPMLGLTYYFLQQQSRPFQAIEEASLLQILLAKKDHSQSELALRLGKSKSWVCQRLKLISDLPDFLQKAIYEETLSTWAAQRIMIPFARANEEHAKKFIEYQQNNPRSTRELEDFYTHYMRSNRKIRSEMINQLELFFNTAAQTQEGKTKLPNQTPDVRWSQELQRAHFRLGRLEADIPHIFYANQPKEERDSLLAPLQLLRSSLDLIDQTIRSIHHA